MSTTIDAKREVLRATDIVLLIEQYVPLVRAGRYYKARCPFHQEKTPSFTVSPERATWKCFGCGKGGNAIDFMIEREGLDFKGALRVLADRAGIRLPQRGRGEGDGGAAEARLEALELHRVAQDFYRRALLESREGERAREYVHSRGIDEESAERWGLGYAPQGFGFLLKIFEKRGLDPARVERAGLAKPRRDGRGHLDLFRGRLMFPIHDEMGRVIGFGGRALSDEDHPKYLNSPESPIFHKRELIYGLHLAKESARERGEVALVEGYTDAILAHQAGFPWVVSILGTAFGAPHARILARHASRLLVFFDGDAAGMSANRRGLVEAGRAGIALFRELRVATLPDGLDPADLIVARGASALADTIGNAVSLSEFFQAAAGTNTADRVKALDEVCEILASLEQETYRELEIRATAERFRVDESVVRRRVRHFLDLAMNKTNLAASNQSAPHAKQDGRAASGAQGASAGGGAPDEPALERVERWALECLVASPELLEDARAQIPLDAFRDPRARAIADAIFRGERPEETEVDAVRRLFADVATGLDANKDYRREWRGVVARLLGPRAAEPGCTKDGLSELKETVARKLESLGIRSRELGLDGGGLATTVEGGI